MQLRGTAIVVVSMSETEFSRLNVLLEVQAKRLKVAEAASVLQLHRRQIFPLLRGLRQRGAASLASKRRKASNNRLPAAVRDLTMSLVKAHYADFGPTLAAEKLHEQHSCLVLRETLRKWMIEGGLWIDRKRGLPSVHQPRNRRERGFERSRAARWPHDRDLGARPVEDGRAHGIAFAEIRCRADYPARRQG